jgi:hypothetical protein
MIVRDLLQKSEQDLVQMLEEIDNEPLDWTPVVLSVLTLKTVEKLVIAADKLQESSSKVESLTKWLIALTIVLGVFAAPPACEVVVRAVMESRSSHRVAEHHVARMPASNWNDQALLATPRSVWLEGDRGKESPVFFYVVENKTSRDFVVHDANEVQLFVRDDLGALDNSWGPAVSIDLPLLIPAGEKASVTLHFRLIESVQPKSRTQADVQTFVKDPHRAWSDYKGFVMLHPGQRYRITFPKPT